MRLLRFLLLVLLSGALLPELAIAQGSPPTPPAPSAVESEDGDRSATHFRLADSYVRAQQYDRAIALLEDLHADDPHSFPVYDRLKESYVGARRYDDAIRLIEGQIERTGRTAVLFAEIGSLHLDAGRPANAERAWREAVATAPDRAQTYRTLYAVFVRQRQWERARDVLLEARRALRQDDLFRVELADLYARSDQHAEALEEWAGFLSDDPSRLALVQSRMSRMLDQEGVTTTFRDALDRLIRREPMRLPYRRLAAWLAAEDGAYDAALDHNRALDRLGQEQGESLFAFAEAALHAGAYDPALRAFELVLEAHPEAPSAASALLSSALLFQRRAEEAQEERAADKPNAREARDRYLRFIEAHPGHPNATHALHHLATLHRDTFRDYPEAERWLRTLLDQFPLGESATAARLQLGELALLQDDLTRARAAFTQVESQARTGELAERARLELARIDYYEGHFDAALARASAMTRNTATNVANNAIALRLLLTENRGPDASASPLRRFARAELRQRQHRPEDALVLLDALELETVDHPLAAEVLFRRASVLRDLGQPHEALAALEALPERFPESYLADRALFTAADLHERDLQDGETAMARYLQFLTRYPGSLLAPEARTRVRRLRGNSIR